MSPSVPSFTDSPAGDSSLSPALQSSIDAIPFANEGDLITRDHHNTLRSALAQIAASVDQTQLAPVQTLSFTPVLLPVAGAGLPWRTSMGVALGPASGDEAEGWMALDLPNATNIDSLTLRGKMPKPVAIWTVALRRIELAGALQSDVGASEIQTTTKSADGSFVVDVAATKADLTPTQAAELRRVDNTRYRYLFHTAMAGAEQADALELRLVQVTCTRG